MKKHLLLSLICSSVLTLAGCSTTEEPDAKKAAQDEPMDVLDDSINKEKAPVKAKPLSKIPLAVQQDIMQQGLADARDSLMVEKRMDVAANQIPAANFFSAIVADSDYSIAVHPDVKGNITLNLSEVTLKETLDIVQDMYGYDIRKFNRVIQIYPAGMRTQTIPLNYLFLKRAGLSSTSINSGGVSTNDPNAGGNGNQNGQNGNSNNSSSNNSNNGQGGSQNQVSGINISTENESDYWTELEQTLQSLIGTEDGRNVVISPQAGLITIKALPNEIKAIEEFIQTSEQHLRRQVIIEAKILEVTLNDDYQQGISWAAIGDVDSGSVGFGTSGNVAGNAISTAIGGGGNFVVQGTDFSGILTLLSTQGKVQTLSSPRVTATNNQKAVIKVGEDEYFVTEISSTTITGNATTVTPEIELTPFFSGIALDVTPQINEDGEVILHVHPSVTITSEQVKSVSFNQEEILLPLARSRVRESDTIVKAKSGEVIVLGGLIESSKTDIVSKTPYLGDIPYLGELFTNRSESIVKKELVILLKPVVVGKETWQDQIKEARSLLQKWFPESE
ncbi:pilus (MSHA type) biogenesis protein MshL [Thalassomonas sp. M1454]|uniref:pilus (MSHA type) biogenesis protein MshL n=1 Tax=Thalassomonas sp. M1454 TaxID=2594477 RepID=UPI00117E64BA|nr:pilus (MSHA type) biogenesis protein MshL [Thalassomonas sp. M1454]TRX52811.1 pilus (MSHA type) biogenesis protein MshL [Thalassomonas sp. M1454]